MVQLSPTKLEFGHIMENPKGWEDRYERKDLDKLRFQGKVILLFFSYVKKIFFLYSYFCVPYRTVTNPFILNFALNCFACGVYLWAIIFYLLIILYSDMQMLVIVFIIE